MAKLNQDPPQMDPDSYVLCKTCKLIHANLKELCDLRHDKLGEAIGATTSAAITEALGQFPRPDELREVLTQRSTDRAWSLLGKIVSAAVGIYLALDRIHALLK